MYKAFQSVDWVQDALYKLENLKQEKKTAEQVVTEFKQLIGQAGLTTKSMSNNIHFIWLFWKTLNYSLAHKIMFGEVIPRMIDDWFEKAIQFDTNYWEAMAIFGQNRKNDTKITNRSKGNASNAGRQGTERLIAQMKQTERKRRRRNRRKSTQWRMLLPQSEHWQKMKEKPLQRWCWKAKRIFKLEDWISVSTSFHYDWPCTSSRDWKE